MTFAQTSSVASILILSSIAHADLLAQAELTGGSSSPFHHGNTLAHIQLVETDVGYFGDTLYEIPVEDATTYIDWQVGADNLNQTIVLNQQVPGFYQLATLLTNGQEDYFSSRSFFAFDNPDAPASGVGHSVALSELALLGSSTDLNGLSVDRIELTLTEYDITIDDIGVTDIRYAIRLDVFGTVPTPATLFPFAFLACARRRR